MATDIRHPSEPRKLSDVLASVDEMVRTGAAQELIPFPTMFSPLDQVLAGGLRPGDMMLVGGTPGVGKTVCTLQWARNLALQGVPVVYVCYEHEESALLARLLALELGE